MQNILKDIRHEKPQKSALLVSMIVVVAAIVLALVMNFSLHNPWPMNILILLSPALFALIFIRPLWGIVFIIVLSYMDSLQRAGASSVSGIKVVLIFTAFTWLLLKLMNKAKRKKSPFDIPLLLFSLALITSLFLSKTENAYYLNFHFRAIAATLSFIAIIFMCGSFIINKQSFFTILKTIIVCASLTALLGVAQFITKDQVVKIYTTTTVHQAVGAGYTPGGQAMYNSRSTGTTFNANAYAFRLAIVLPLAIAFLYAPGKKRTFLFNIIMSLAIYILAFGLLLSQSRSNYISMGLTFVVMLFFVPKKSRLNFSIFFIILPFIFAGILLISYGVYERPPVAEDTSISNRIFNYVIIKDVLLDHPSFLLTGTGFGGFPKYSIDYMNIYGLTRIPVLHNDFTRLAVEFGILVFTFYIFLWGTIFSSVPRLFRDIPRERIIYVPAFVMSFVSIFLQSISHTSIFVPFLWLIIALYASLYQIDIKGDQKAHETYSY